MTHTVPVIWCTVHALHLAHRICGSNSVLYKDLFHGLASFRVKVRSSALSVDAKTFYTRPVGAITLGPISSAFSLHDGMLYIILIFTTTGEVSSTASSSMAPASEFSMLLHKAVFKELT